MQEARGGTEQKENQEELQRKISHEERTDSALNMKGKSNTIKAKKYSEFSNGEEISIFGLPVEINRLCFINK